MTDEIKDFLFRRYTKDLGLVHEIVEFKESNVKKLERLSQKYGLFRVFEKESFEKSVGMLENAILQEIKVLLG